MSRVLAPAGRDRFTAARRSVRRRRWLAPLVVVLVVALVAGAGWLLGWSSVLTVSHLEVRGASRPVQKAVRAAVWRGGAAAAGTPLARVDTRAVEEQVAALPPVESVHVHRGWPHTLVVDIVERRPAAALRARGGYQLVDADGVVFRWVSHRPDGVPVLVASTNGSGRAARVAALAVVASLPHSLRADLTTVRAATPDDIRLRLHGVTVLWGDSEQTARKAEVLAALMGQHADVYDVSAPDLPTTRG